MSKVTKDRFGEPLWCGPTEVKDPLCVWRRCFNEHDLGYISSTGKRIKQGQCLTRYHSGCPADHASAFEICCERPEFAHISPGQLNKFCRNCGTRVPVEVVKCWLARTLRRPLSTYTAEEIEEAAALAWECDS